MKVTRSLFCAALAAAAAFGQTSPARPEFEVASVKPSASGAPDQVKVGLHIDGAQIHITYLSLKDYIATAYRVKEYQVSGPAWLASERFDIDAKLPDGALREQVADMLQALLADRFQMKMHRDSKEFSVYGLVVASGGPRVKESPDAGAGSAGAGDGAVQVGASGGREGVSINFGNGSYFAFGNNRMEARKLTMADFAVALARFSDRPVVDMTDLKSNYDFTLELSPEDYTAMLIRAAITAGVALPPEALRAMESATNDSLFAALRKLGLKLEPRQAPLEVLVIDQIRKTPAAN